ncbi:hypothetical protein BDP27DRAFT_1361217 [Rhodocollybia butyracea]|uniref:Uncharacterized protein n=1 Tax=Rhodocollybia butyracea TaxID=206335 RepID=A0A9P5UAL5_9AGAR|nr:hypothetical protein BDP27DRAFT_1361217 [Rhodocollybia butyracea]
MADYDKFLSHALSKQAASTPVRSSSGPRSDPALASIDQLLKKEKKHKEKATAQDVPHDYDLNVMSTIVLDKDLPSNPVSTESVLNLVYQTIVTNGIPSMISTEAGHTETLDEFGVDTNVASARAVTAAQRLQKVADDAMGSLESLDSIDLEQTTVQATLLNAEASLVYVRKNLGSIKRKAATEYVDKIKTTAETLERLILKWRIIYPDTSPVKIDNRPIIHKILPPWGRQYQAYTNLGTTGLVVPRPGNTEIGTTKAQVPGVLVWYYHLGPGAIPFNPYLSSLALDYALGIDCLLNARLTA